MTKLPKVVSLLRPDGSWAVATMEPCVGCGRKIPFFGRAVVDGKPKCLSCQAVKA